MPTTTDLSDRVQREHDALIQLLGVTTRLQIVVGTLLDQHEPSTAGEPMPADVLRIARDQLAASEAEARTIGQHFGPETTARLDGLARDALSNLNPSGGAR